MRQLAALLRESSFAVDLTDERGECGEDAIGAFRCLGFVEELDGYQLAYVFEIPHGMTVQSLAASYSLATFIESQASKCLLGKGPSTTDKLHIALALCRNILNIHASDWVHY